MITLITTVWERDFDHVLDEKSWFLNYKSEQVTEKTLVINNIKPESRERLLKKIATVQTKHKINVLFVDEHAEEAKQFFNLDSTEETLGYRYTIQYFVFILQCTTPYILNVSADCDMFFEDDYLKHSTDILKRDPNAIITTLPCVVPWRKDYVDAGPHEQQAMFKTYGKTYPPLEHFYYSAGCSDQTFFGDVEKLKKVDYTRIHPDATQFPAYGGDCFEKRLCSHFLYRHAYRLMYKKYHYVHHVPKPQKQRFWQRAQLFIRRSVK